MESPDSSADSTAEFGFWTEDYQQAISQARLENKLVMAMFTGSDWCSWCVRLEKEVFSQPDFQRWAAANCVPLKLDFPRKGVQPTPIAVQNRELAQRYSSHVGGYPSVLFLDADGNVVGSLGYIPGGPDAWIRQAKNKVPSLE